MIVKKVVGVGILAAALLFMSATASSAAVSPSPVTPGVVASDAAILAQLNAQVGTQSRAEIDRIAKSSAPAQLLANPNTGELLAAIATPVSPTVQPLSTTWRTPGCGAGDACVYANGGGTSLGFYGYGSTLAFTMNNVTRWYTGNRTGNLSTSSYVFAATVNKTTNFSPAGNFVSIARF